MIAQRRGQLAQGGEKGREVGLLQVDHVRHVTKPMVFDANQRLGMAEQPFKVLEGLAYGSLLRERRRASTPPRVGAKSKPSRRSRRTLLSSRSRRTEPRST